MSVELVHWIGKAKRQFINHYGVLGKPIAALPLIRVNARSTACSVTFKSGKQAYCDKTPVHGHGIRKAIPDTSLWQKIKQNLNDTFDSLKIQEMGI